MNLDQANDCLLKLLSETDGPITLGLLPVEENEQSAIIALVISEVHGDAIRLIRLLRFRHAAAVAYVLSAAASQAVTQGGTFWGPFSQRLKLSLDNPTQRSELSETFVGACRHLGVVDPDVSDMGWPVVAPLMAQASILHCWADGLAKGMRMTLKHRPLPDLEDQFALAYFAGDLADHIHNQPNLRNILQTEVGGVVAQRLIKSCVFGQFDLLPPHLRGPMREAFEGEGKQVALKSPHVTFSLADGGFALILPKQPPKLISERSHWDVNGCQYSARADLSLSEHELGAQELEVKIRHLQKGYEDQSFRVSLALDRSFRVFDASSGRELTVRIGEENDFPPSEYLVVMHPDARSDIPDAEELVGDYRLLDKLELRPGVLPLGIEADGVRTTLAPSLKAGLYYAAAADGAVELEDGLRLHYGEAFRFLAYIPRSQHSGQVRIEVNHDEHKLLAKDLPVPAESGSVYDYSDGVEDVMREAVAGLEPGIHPLKVRMSTEATSVARSLWYWKGLLNIGKYSGFRCLTIPGNLDYMASRGIRPSNDGCVMDPGYHAPRIVLALRSGVRLTLLRPGIRATCIEPTEGDELELRPGEMLSVTDADSRVLVFESGGFEPWSIECNSSALAKLDRRKTVFRIGLRSLIAQFGKTGGITATGPSGDKLTLVRFASLLIANRLSMELDHRREFVCWRTCIPSSDLGRLGLRVCDYSHHPRPVVGEVLVAYTEGELRDDTAIEQPLGDGVSALTTLLPAEGNLPERVKLVLEVDLNKTNTQLLLIDVLRSSVQTDDWVPLHCADGYNLSRLSITSSGGAHVDPATATWWNHLWRTSSKHHTPEATILYDNLTETEVASALREIGTLTAIKYPSAVYSGGAKYLSSLAHKLSTRRNEAGHRDNDAWWTEGVIELAKHSAENITPIVRQFLFSCNPHCLRRNWQRVVAAEASEGAWLVSALRLSLDVTEAGGRVPYAARHFHSQRHSPELFGSFANFGLVVRGQASDFACFDFEKFFKPILARAEQHEESATLLDTGPLLSARHLLHAIRALNRRARVLEKASTGDAEHPLRGALQTLTVALHATDNMMTPLHQKIGFVPWGARVDFDNPDHYETPSAPPLPLLASEQAERLHRLTWRFCVIIRGTAQGRISKDTFATVLKHFSGDMVQTHPINLILSFAPELFAYYCGLLDFALYAPISSEP